MALIEMNTPDAPAIVSTFHYYFVFFISMLLWVLLTGSLAWQELAEEEKEHFDLFSRLAQDPSIEDQVTQQIQIPVEDRRFSDYIQLPDLGEKPNDQTILQYAMGREDAAMKQYRELANSTGPGAIHDLFEFLANEETKHKQELEKLYYELIHSGGPGN
jgi:ferritin-like protein